MPQLRSDAKAAAGAVSRVVSPLGSMIKKGVGAVKSAIGQTPPTPEQVHTYLARKGVSNDIANRLIELTKQSGGRADVMVLPHTKLSAEALGYDPDANRARWEKLLKAAGIANRVERFDILLPLVKADIAAWMPLVESDSGR